MGSRSKLTPKLQQTIVGLLEHGNYVEDIIPQVPISRPTYFNWLAAGRNVRDAAPTDDENAATYRKWRTALSAKDTRHLDFLDAVEKAHTQATIGLLGDLRDIGSGRHVIATTTETTEHADGSITVNEYVRYALPKWQALAWILERRDFERFGRRVQVEITEESLVAELAKLEAEMIDIGEEIE